MKDSAQSSERSRFLFSVVLAMLFGSALGIALAQQRPPGQVDTACASQCVANGYDSRYCDQICWIPDPASAANGVAIDWICLKDCRDKGGKHGDCRQRCVRK